VKDVRLLGTNVVGFKNKYIVDGMVRPTYHLHKTTTGRSSSENPNGQNFPVRGANATAYRAIFEPPPGHFILSGDLSQIELRIAACMAKDETMINVFSSEGDIHTETALIILGNTIEEFMRLPKEDRYLGRYRAKSVNFGFIFGMWWRAFVGYAKTQYGVTFTNREAEQIREGFFEKYYRLNDWHTATKEYAHRHKRVRSYSGRIRHLPMIDSEDDLVRGEAERQAINAPVQEFGSSLGVMALSRIDEEIDPRCLRVVGFIHDAIITYVPCAYLDWGARTLKHYMESNPIEQWFGPRLPVPIVAEVSFGLNLGETYELEGLQVNRPYDFEALWEKEGKVGCPIPAQRIPARGGRAARSIYTVCEANLE
jgi:DNA polymerase I-like protein with 3'-5' exonuclease and polymerase domains